VLILDVQSKTSDDDLFCPFRWLDLINEKLKPGDAFPDIVFAAAFGNSHLALKHGANAFLPLVSGEQCCFCIEFIPTSH
jgi:hypothetical protein